MRISTPIRAILATSLALLFTVSVLAHTALKEAVPADGTAVKVAPAHIDLLFNGPVQLIKLELMGVAGSYTHFRAHETREDLVCRLLLEKKKNYT